LGIQNINYNIIIKYFSFKVRNHCSPR